MSPGMGSAADTDQIRSRSHETARIQQLMSTVLRFVPWSPHVIPMPEVPGRMRCFGNLYLAKITRKTRIRHADAFLCLERGQRGLRKVIQFLAHQRSASSSSDLLTFGNVLATVLIDRALSHPRMVSYGRRTYKSRYSRCSGARYLLKLPRNSPATGSKSAATTAACGPDTPSCADRYTPASWTTRFRLRDEPRSRPTEARERRTCRQA